MKDELFALIKIPDSFSTQGNTGIRARLGAHVIVCVRERHDSVLRRVIVFRRHDVTNALVNTQRQLLRAQTHIHSYDAYVGSLCGPSLVDG